MFTSAQLKFLDENPDVAFAQWIPFLFAVSVGVAVAAWNGFLIPVNEDPSVWFQRSGSLIVLIGIYSEGFLFRMRNNLSERYKESWHFPAIAYVSHTNIIIGTIIWGYGDVFYF